MKKIIITLLLAFSLIASVYAEVLPHGFRGDVFFSDSPVADGTIITAKLNGNAVDTAIVEEGRYGYGNEGNETIPKTPDTLIVTDDQEQGGIITFYINNIKADQEVAFESGRYETDFVLTFAGTAPPGTVPTGNITNNTTNTTNTNQTENPSEGGDSSSGSGDSGGSSSGGGGGGGGSSSGGSSGGGSTSSNDDQEDEPSTPQSDDLSNSDDDYSNTFEDTQVAALQGTADGSKGNAPQGLANLLTGAFTGAFSKTSGKLIFIAAVFILALLSLTLFRHLKKKKK